MRPHGRFAHRSCKIAALTLDLGLSASAAGSWFLHLQCANRPFWPLVLKYTIFYVKSVNTIWFFLGFVEHLHHFIE